MEINAYFEALEAPISPNRYRNLGEQLQQKKIYSSSFSSIYGELIIPTTNSKTNVMRFC